MIEQLDIRRFEGPLDLLDYLLERNRAPIESIPIAQITEQYIDLIQQSMAQGLDMDLASEFLVMAATLLQIKSRMLLPGREEGVTDFENDPREELVLRLMAYRRCKLFAAELKEREKLYAFSTLRRPATANELDISVEEIADSPKPERLEEAIQNLLHRNTERFGLGQQRIRQLLKRERFSVKDKMTEIMTRLSDRARVLFSDLYPRFQTSKAEQISAFLALLELWRRGQVKLVQKKPFAVILIEKTEITVEADSGDINEKTDRTLPEGIFNE